MKITFISRKIEGFVPSSLGARSFPVVDRLAYNNLKFKFIKKLLDQVGSIGQFERRFNIVTAILIISYFDTTINIIKAHLLSDPSL